MDSITTNKGGKIILLAAGVLVCMLAFALTTLALSPAPGANYSSDALIVRSIAMGEGSCTLDLATPEGLLEVPGLRSEECSGLSVGDDVTEAFFGTEADM